MHRSPIFFPALAGKEIDKISATNNVVSIDLINIVVPFFCCGKKRLRYAVNLYSDCLPIPVRKAGKILYDTTVFIYIIQAQSLSR
jgi:hypothetical protein